MVIKAADFSKAEARQLIVSVFNDLTQEVDNGIVLTSDRPDLELQEQRTYAQDHIASLSASLGTAAPHPAAKHIGEAAVMARGWDIGQVPEARRLDLYHGVTRALIEQQELFLLRLEDRLAPFRPTDPLFANVTDINCLPAPLPAKSADLGPTIAAAVDEYLKEGRKKWTAKTLKSRQRMLGYLVEHMGANRSLASITPHDVRSYRDAIRRLRSNHHTSPNLTFAGKQTENEATRIAPKTASLIFEPTKAFMAWSKSTQGFIATNPASDIRMEVPKQAHAAKTRRPFTAEELKVLFSAPVFRGCKSARRRSDPGAYVFRDALYWIPILGFYTGSRLGELVQLHLTDACLDGPIPYIDVTDAEGGEPGSDTAKHVKSAAGVRRIPIHPHLIQLGFAEFVAERRKFAHGRKRLFWEIAFGADGQASTVFSKKFGRILDRIGLTDPALVFHSFRHGVEDALRDALQPQYLIDRVIGHSDGSVSAQYGKGISLEVAANAIAAMRLPVDLVAILSGGIADE